MRGSQVDRSSEEVSVLKTVAALFAAFALVVSCCGARRSIGGFCAAVYRR